jgi:CheY-like chemotaxis protein
MLKTVSGSSATFELEIDDRPLPIEADVSQFETALVNLAANARDAMERGGRLKIRAAVSPEDVTVPPDGRFVTVAVSDTGCGIPTEQIDRIFEPFFTTKDIGRGTGLGLSQVYGFVHQSGGSVDVDSQVGQGTTLTLRLPLSSKPIVPDQDAVVRSVGTPERGNVLVVEDNVEVGEFATQLLHDLGYRTVLARNADEALKLLDETPGHFDVVLSDVVMPGLDGVALGREIRRRVPDLPVVLNSGYSHVLADDGDHGFDLIHKPYSVEELSSVLRRALASGAQSRLGSRSDPNPRQS